jgi:hypothetical protein
MNMERYRCIHREQEHVDLIGLFLFSQNKENKTISCKHLCGADIGL